MSFMIIIPRASLPAFRTAVRTAPKPGVFATIKRDIHTRPNVTSLPSLVNAARRKFATATDYSLAEAIMSDQDDILVYADEFRRHVGNDDKQARWGNQLTWAIARYNVGEEIVLYPLLEEFLGGQGKKFADMDRKDSIELKKHLYNLDGMKPGTDRYEREFNSIMSTIEKQMDREASNDIPMLEDALGPDASRRAAEKFVQTRKFAPALPDPEFATPNDPIVSVASFLQTPIDELKDRFEKSQFPTPEMFKEAEKHIH